MQMIVTSLHSPGVQDWAQEDQTVQLPLLVIRVLLFQNVRPGSKRNLRDLHFNSIVCDNLKSAPL